jgi:hypothetical protein
LAVRRWGGRSWGDQTGDGLNLVGPALVDPVLAGPSRLDQRVDDLGDLIRAGPCAAGTGRDGFLYDQSLTCQNQHHETADGPLRGGRSEGDWHWGGSETRVPAPLLQSATWMVLVF